MKKLIGTIILISVLLSAVVLALPAQAESDELVRYGYTTITEPNVKYVYEKIRDAMLESTPPASIEFSQSKKINVAELKKGYMLYVSDYPECFWLYNSYTYSHIDNDIVYIYPKYSFEGEALVEAKLALESTVNDIMRGLPNTSNYDKALYLHDALTKHVTYEFVGEHQTAYGALVAGKAVCAGYTSAYQLLLNRAGIQAWSVSGDATQNGDEAIPHAWNVVWIEDGVCVYTDVTWDDGPSGLFHYYFNISKDEMSSDHIVSADTFILPDCTHDDKSYFDINNCAVSDSTTMQELAKLFGPAQQNQREAVLCYVGDNVEAFLDRMHEEQDALYAALNVQSGKCGYKFARAANEIHLIVTGNFTPTSYSVKISHHDTVQTYDESVQYVKIGEAMKAQRFFAGEGYYFPASYSAKSINGIKVTRVSAREISVSGTPSANTEIYLPAATATRKEATPSATVTANAHGGVTISNVENGMKYSFDAVNWVDITSSDDIEINRISASLIYVVKKGNGEDTDDSDVQTLTVPKYTVTTEPETTDNVGNSSSDTTEQNTSISNTDNPFADKPLFGCKMSLGGSALALVVSIAACGAVIIKKDKE